MGRGLNPADEQRKLDKKKEIQRHKKQNAERAEVRTLLSDPDKIESELQKLRAESNSNKLDLTLKNKIKEMEKMKDIAVKKLENQKLLDQMRSNSLRGIQEAERQDKTLKSNMSKSEQSINNSQQNIKHPPPRSTHPPQQAGKQTPRPILVGGLHGVPLPPPLVGNMQEVPSMMMGGQPAIPMPGHPMMMPMPGHPMMMPMPGHPMMMPMAGHPMMLPMAGHPMMMPMAGHPMMMPLPGQPMMMPRSHQSTAGRVPPKRQNMPTTANVDPMDPKGENYVERFIGHDRLQKQQQQQQQQQQLQQQQLQQLQQLQQQQTIQGTSEDNSKWSKFETDIDGINNENERKDDKWSKYETEMDESQLEVNDSGNNNDEWLSNQQYEYETNDNYNNDDKWSKWEAESSLEINAEEIMRRRFAVNESSDVTATIPDFNINIEELMRRRNMIPGNDEDDSHVGPSVGPAAPTESFEIFQSLQSLPTVEELLEQENHDGADVRATSKPSNNGTLIGLLQYGSDDEDDIDDYSNYNNNKEISANIIPISTSEYALNIPMQQVIEPKKPAQVKIKPDSALTNFVPTSLKMKRPNPNTTSSNPVKKQSTQIFEESNTTIHINNSNNDNSKNKEDDYAKFLAEISGL